MADRDRGHSSGPAPPQVSRKLETWFEGEGAKTLGGLLETVGEKSFAMLFLVLLSVPALPLPTGGVTHVFEIVAMLLALQLIVGRDQIWLPQRWQDVELGGPRQRKFVDGLIKTTRRLESFARPRLSFLFNRRFSDNLFGLVALIGSIAAFIAPPFSGLDTLPAMGIVVLSVAVLMGDAAIALLGVALLAIGIALEILLGGALLKGITELF